MTCSRCGDVCRCVPDERPTADSPPPRLESDAEGRPSRLQIDAHLSDSADPDASARASTTHGEPGESLRPGFVVEPLAPETYRSQNVQNVSASIEEVANGEVLAEAPLQPALLADPSAPTWRTEVSEKLHHYRARRRPRGPRYPSLRLKFEAEISLPTDHAVSPPSPLSTAPIAASRQALAFDCAEIEPVEAASESGQAAVVAGTAQAAPPPFESHRNDATAKIIEFPRSMYSAPAPLHELADPVVDRPRILEAPEVAPPPPALGGITIEESRAPESEPHSGIDVPLQVASLDRRLLAVAFDAVIVLMALVAFGAIFYRITGKRLPLTQLFAPGAGLMGLLWAAYQYLLMVYSGTTLGLRAMKLQLQRFDGSFPSRRLRRWRTLGSMLSGISLGMGYAWQFLDEEGLCWHERVTNTYLAPRKQIKTEN